MTLPNVGKMNQKSVRALTETLRGDPALKREAITLLRSRKPLDFVNQCFTLDERQRDALNAVVSKTNADAMARFYILILENDDIEISFERTAGDPEVNFSMTATNLTPNARAVVAAAKKKGGKKPGKGTTVDGEGKFRTRC